jgi:hypothetical protein
MWKEKDRLRCNDMVYIKANHYTTRQIWYILYVWTGWG